MSVNTKLTRGDWYELLYSCLITALQASSLARVLHANVHETVSN